MSVFETYVTKTKTLRKQFTDKIAESELHAQQLFLADKDRAILSMLNDYDKRIDSRDRGIIRRRRQAETGYGVQVEAD